MIKIRLKNISISTTAKIFLLVAVFFGYLPSYAQIKNENDTFKVANGLIAKKKYRKAYNYLGHYSQDHPKDYNSLWLGARAKLFLNDFKQSDHLYQRALKIEPGNDNLRLDYIHSLLDMGKNERAEGLLKGIESKGKSYADMYFLYAQLSYWEGNYKKASIYLEKALDRDNGKPEWYSLRDQLDIARAPKVSLYSSYITDNQPLTAVVSTLRFEKYFSRLLSLYINCDEYHFLQDKVSDAPWITIGDKLFFPKAGLQINAGGGVFKFPVKNETGWSGHLGVTKKISQQFNLELTGDHVPYFDSKTSIDTNITATKLSAILNWHKRSWIGQAAFMTSLYDSNVYVYTAYGWIMAPIATFSFGQLLMGYSASYSNSNVNSYIPVNSLNEIVANFTPNQSIAGIYSPYFTPNNQIINSALLSLNMTLSKHVSILISGDIGYGTINNPYLFLDKNSAGTLFINKGYSMESFVPADATVGFNYHIDKTWLIQAKYVYRNTYFFTSNYGSLGIEKNFLHRKKHHSQARWGLHL